MGHRLRTNEIHALDLGSFRFELCQPFDILVDASTGEAETLTCAFHLLLQGYELGLGGSNGLILVATIFQGAFDLHATCV
jgi:hypothetical protein